MEEQKQEVKEELLNAQNAFISEAECGDVIRISDAVLTTIVKKFTLEVAGVVRFQNQSLVDGMLDIIRSRNTDRSIVIEHADGGAVITVTLILLFGANVPEVCKDVQATIREKIKSLTGYDVKKVNINVTGIEEPAPAADEADPAIIPAPIMNA